MIITTIKNKDNEIKFKAENIIDGMKIGIIKEKLQKKGIPIKMGMNLDSTELDITIKQKDLMDLLC